MKFLPLVFMLMIPMDAKANNALKYVTSAKNAVGKRLICLVENKNVIFINVSSPVTGPEWPRGFQEVKVPRFHDNGTGWW